MRVPVSRIVLVGLPGAGKTTVGERLAARLGWRFLDPDRSIEQEAGLDIPAIFRTRGEAAFRALERTAVEKATAEERVVIAPGGGWAAQEEVYESLPAGSLVVWLQVAPAEAVRRLSGSDVERPLLSHGDMALRLAELDGERALAYARADMVVKTDGSTPEDVVEEIATRLVSEFGIDGRAY
jgi:shikimate kinase